MAVALPCRPGSTRRPRVARRARENRQRLDVLIEENRDTISLEFTARYKKWLEYIGPKFWGPVGKADYEKIIAEEAAAKQAEGKS